jgi:hypothetical protein
MPQLTPEERAELMRIQDRLIELYVEQREVQSAGDSSRADAIAEEIDELQKQRGEIHYWATDGSA